MMAFGGGAAFFRAWADIAAHACYFFYKNMHYTEIVVQIIITYGNKRKIKLTENRFST